MIESTASVKDLKERMRRSASAIRAELFTENEGRAAKILAEFADNFDPSGANDVVSAYVPIGSEIDGMGLLERFFERGFVTGLPLVTAAATPLTFLNYCPGDRLVKGNFDVLTPEHTVTKVVPTILLVPLLAFDGDGFRLGYGGGFYDRTLAALKQQRVTKAIGLAFSGQEVDAVPRDGFDHPLDGILCENGYREFSVSQQGSGS